VNKVERSVFDVPSVALYVDANKWKDKFHCACA